MPRDPSPANTNRPGARGAKRGCSGRGESLPRSSSTPSAAPMAARHRRRSAAAGRGSPSASRRGRRARRARRWTAARPSSAGEALDVGAVVFAARRRIDVVLVRGRAEPGRAVERRQQVAGAGERQAQRRGRRPARGRRRRWSGRAADRKGRAAPPSRSRAAPALARTTTSARREHARPPASRSCQRSRLRRSDGDRAAAVRQLSRSPAPSA